MEYAVILAGGKQYRVAPGAMLEVERLDGAEGSQIELKPVLALRKESVFKVGAPAVEGASVSAQILGHRKGPKVISFKFKRRKGYHRKIGHRQAVTRLKILEIRSEPNGSH